MWSQGGSCLTPESPVDKRFRGILDYVTYKYHNSRLRIVCTISFHYSCPWISSMSCTAFKITRWCLVFAMFYVRLFICALWSPAGKGLTSWLSFVVSSVSLSLSHWYPGSGVVLDCINSWSLHHFLLLDIELQIKRYMLRRKSLVSTDTVCNYFVGQS